MKTRALLVLLLAALAGTAAVFLLRPQPESPVVTPPRKSVQVAPDARAGSSERMVTTAALPEGLFATLALSGDLAQLESEIGQVLPGFSERLTGQGAAVGTGSWVRVEGIWGEDATALLLLPVNEGLPNATTLRLEHQDAMTITLTGPDLAPLVRKADKSLRNVAEGDGSRFDGPRLYRVQRTGDVVELTALLDLSEAE